MFHSNFEALISLSVMSFLNSSYKYSIFYDTITLCPLKYQDSNGLPPICSGPGQGSNLQLKYVLLTGNWTWNSSVHGPILLTTEQKQPGSYVFTDMREWKGDRNITEKHQHKSAASWVHPTGSSLQSGHVPWPRIQAGISWYMGRYSTTEQYRSSTKLFFLIEGDQSAKHYPKPFMYINSFSAHRQ